MTEMTTTPTRTLRGRLNALPRDEKVLLGTVFVLAGAALTLGVVFALIMGLDEAGWITLPPLSAFQLLTLHATNVFYYWLYFVQAGTMLALLLVYTEGARLGPRLGLGAWLALALMCAGWALNLLAPVRGAAVTYSAPLGLSGDFEGASTFYAGYVLLALGLLTVGFVGVAAGIEAKRRTGRAEWSAIGYAAFLWYVLLMVAAVIALMANVPALQVALGLKPFLKGFKYTMSWSVYFHNMHYLPLLSTVLVWYALSEATTGVKSIFGERFSKLVFSSYLVLVPPTSLYHLFLEPEVPVNTKLLGSVLALLISIPTLAVFLIIVTSLQACASGQGHRGIFAWVRALPWRNPAFAAIGMATVAALAGGVFSNVVIQERFAPLVSDTFMVPGYFHFFTVGTVTLTFLGTLIYLVPALTGRRLALPSLATALPYVLTAGVYVFGLAGVAAGYMGAPRRTISFDYGGTAPETWGGLMAVVGIGAVIMSVAILAYMIILARTAIGAVRAGRPLEDLPVAAFTVGDAAGQPAWFGALSMAIFVAGMYAATLAAFWVMQGLPLG